MSRSLSGKSCSQSKILSIKYPPRQARAPLPPLQTPPVRFWPTVGVGVFRTNCLFETDQYISFIQFTKNRVKRVNSKYTFDICHSSQRTCSHVIRPNGISWHPIACVAHQYFDSQYTWYTRNRAAPSMPYDILLESHQRMRHSLVVIYPLFPMSKRLLVPCIEKPNEALKTVCRFAAYRMRIYRKSGIPAEVLMPAPVCTTTCFDAKIIWANCAHFSSTVFSSSNTWTLGDKIID